MAIIVNNGVTNIKGTPGAYTGDFATAPSAAIVAPGTIWIDPAGGAIYQAYLGAWVQLTGGGGGGGLTTANNGLSVFGGNTAQWGGSLINDVNITGNNFSIYFDNPKTFSADFNNSQFLVDQNSFFYSDVNNGRGLIVNVANNTYSLGDTSQQLGGFNISNGTGKVEFQNVGLSNGISCDFIHDELFYGNLQNGSYFKIHSGIIESYDSSNNINGLSIDTTNTEYYFGIGGTFPLYISGINLEIRDANTGNGLYISTTEFLVAQNGINLKLDNTLNQAYIGDGGTSGFYVNTNTKLIYTYDVRYRGLSLNFVDQIYQFGEYQEEFSLIIDGANRTVGLGDWDGQFNRTNININDSSKIVGINAEFYFRVDSLNSGFISNGVSSFTLMGDIGNFGNGSIFGVDDNNQRLVCNDGLVVNTSGSSSGRHLKINVNGTDYVIELKNP